MKAWVAAGVLLGATAQEPNEAEKLFRRMEKKLLEAETFALQGESEWKVEKAAYRIKWNVLWAKGHKFNYSIKSVGELIAPDVEGVSDGRDVRVTSGGKTEDRKVSGELGANVAGTLARAGFVASLPVALEGDRPDHSLDKRYALSGFELGKKEKVGERDAQAIRFTAVFAERDTTRSELWIDVKEELPLKRHLSVEGKRGAITVTETYSMFAVGEKIDPAKFELPKK